MKRTSCPQGCPNCNEGDIGGGDYDNDGDTVFRRFFCLKCDTKWTEQYKFEFWTLEK